MVVQQIRHTSATFAAFLAQPENAGRLFELIHGEIIEVTPGRTRYSGIGLIIAHVVLSFSEAHNLPVYVSGGDGAYAIGGQVIAPDFAYKRTPLSEDYPDPDPPLWVVEVISPTDRPYEIRDKRDIYLRAGILLWEVYYKSRAVDVYAPGQPPRSAGLDDTLDAGDLLPGFTLPVKRLFAE